MKLSVSQILVLVFIFLSGSFDQSLAVEPDEILADHTLEARARIISVELRCLVCQNQSIDDSNAPLARDLRILVRERLTAGDTDNEAIDYIVSRYGEFVLLRPRFGINTLILWFAPIFLILVALYSVYRSFRSRRADAGNEAHIALSVIEKKKLDKLLNED